MTTLKRSTKLLSEVNNVNNNQLNIYRYRVDFAKVNNFMDIHGVLMRDLDFPDYYGGNLDAFWDCITDQLLSGLTYIEIFNLDKIKRFNHYDELLIHILRECKHAYNNKYSESFFVTIVHRDGTREEIK